MEWFSEIGIIGSGNVATQFCVHLQKKGLPPLLIYSRNESTGKDLASFYESIYTSELEDLRQCKLIICCISDDSIKDEWATLTQLAPIVSTSGQIDVLCLPHQQPTGVFYPLQSISKSKAVDFSKVPFFIEASSKELLTMLHELGSIFSDTVIELSAEKRRKMHISAVFANNFCNDLLHISANIAERNELNFQWFLPLIEETLSKIKDMHPRDAQTGPAKRGDKQTISEHLSQLTGDEYDIYNLISHHISKTYSSSND